MLCAQTNTLNIEWRLAFLYSTTTHFFNHLSYKTSVLLGIAKWLLSQGDRDFHPMLLG